jgi:hypothetical protein
MRTLVQIFGTITSTLGVMMISATILTGTLYGDVVQPQQPVATDDCSGYCKCSSSNEICRIIDVGSYDCSGNCDCSIPTDSTDPTVTANDASPGPKCVAAD